MSLTQVELVDHQKAYPVWLSFPGISFEQRKGFPMSIEEARELAGELLRVSYEAEDVSRSYVQVKFIGSNGRLKAFTTTYTYFDPSGTLRVGDKVLAGYSGNIAQVVALGRGDYTGVTKPVLAKDTERIAGAHLVGAEQPRGIWRREFETQPSEGIHARLQERTSSRHIEPRAIDARTLRTAAARADEKGEYVMILTSEALWLAGCLEQLETLQRELDRRTMKTREQRILKLEEQLEAVQEALNQAVLHGSHSSEAIRAREALNPASEPSND